MTPPTPSAASARGRRGRVHLSGRKGGLTRGLAGGLAGGLVAVLVVLLATACGSHPARRQPTTLRVFAAASLQQAFTAEGAAFEAGHPGVRVVFSFAGSQSLVAQVEQGAPADVLATADLATIDRVRDRLRDAPAVFAHNQLALVTERGNPLHLSGLADLARPGLKVVLAGPEVPVGKASVAALRVAGVRVRPVSLEDAVTGVVTKVSTGEADAGIAYVTDLHDAQVGGLSLPGTTTALGIAALTGADADAFVAFVRSPAGHRVLTSFGFR